MGSGFGGARTLELGPVLDALAAGFLTIEGVDTFGAKRAKLPIEVLLD